jgi:hypothetical protein
VGVPCWMRGSLPRCRRAALLAGCLLAAGCWVCVPAPVPPPSPTPERQLPTPCSKVEALRKQDAEAEEERRRLRNKKKRERRKGKGGEGSEEEEGARLGWRPGCWAGAEAAGRGWAGVAACWPAGCGPACLPASLLHRRCPAGAGGVVCLEQPVQPADPMTSWRHALPPPTLTHHLPACLPAFVRRRVPGRARGLGARQEQGGGGAAAREGAARGQARGPAAAAAAPAPAAVCGVVPPDEALGDDGWAARWLLPRLLLRLRLRAWPGAWCSPRAMETCWLVAVPAYCQC